MSFDPPGTLSPSKVSAFKDCALAFRFSVIDGLPVPSSVPAVKGTTVHRALELLFGHPAPQRTRALALDSLATALEEIRSDPEFIELRIDGAEFDSFADDAAAMIDRYFTLEDPRFVNTIETELMLETDLDGVTVRGIIDRLDEGPDGELIVVDYKTGRTPRVQQEQARMEGIHVYSLLCEKVLGRRPGAIQLMYLGRSPQVITARPSDRSIRSTQIRLGAVWSAIERACSSEDFRPRPSALCQWCAFKSFCPAFGGDPATATSSASPGSTVRI